jgi:hypothetical protein
MLKMFLAVIAFVCVAMGNICGDNLSDLQPVPSHGAPRMLLNRYCVSCHSAALRTAGLALDSIDVAKIGEKAEVWEKVLGKLNARAMPPAGMPRPNKIEYNSLSSYLERALDQAAEANPNPGRIVPHRLNRTEYANAIRDLIALDIDKKELLPADNSRYGFDNIGNVLTTSPLLMERYLSSAIKITRLAIGDPVIALDSKLYTFPKYLKQEDRMSDALPFGSQGGVAIKHNFPLDGEYVIQVRLQKNFRGYIRGIRRARQADIRLDGVKLGQFSIGGEHQGKSSFIFTSAGTGELQQETYETRADDVLKVRFVAKAGPRLVGISFAREVTMPEGPFEPPLTQYDFAMYKGGNPAVRTVEVTGPYNATGVSETPSRRKIFSCYPTTSEEEDPCAAKILASLARRAYRRSVTDEDLQTLLGFYRTGHSKGGFEAGVGAALERILVGPEFLFHIEADTKNTKSARAYSVSDLELASRLSFFLWSSIPDDQLLRLAENNRLSEPKVLEEQVQRMLADPRSKALVNNFVGQWLQLRNMKVVRPDPDAFGYFDENLREGFQKETELFFESLMREDSSVLELLSADYTFINERLARHYQIPDVYGSHFRRVAVSDEARRGILGHGSVLTVTSYANRTSPVLRGKWVLENILGAAPPPPPPDIPELKERGEDGRVLSMREQMEQHRANPACVVCHAQMDPLGFALENFNGVGGWRTIDANTPIDASGVLPDGTRFEGPIGLRKVLLSRGEEFVTNVTEKLLTYALGRGAEYYDAPAIRKIVREAAPGNYRWSSLVTGIIKSTPFQMRRSKEL